MFLYGLPEVSLGLRAVVLGALASGFLDVSGRDWDSCFRVHSGAFV